MATVKKQIKKKSYQVLKDIGPNDKCPPQSRLIVDTIKAAGGTMTREDLLAVLKRPAESGGLKTEQTAERILGFYRPRLEESGIMKEITETIEVEVEVPDKPEKPAKEKSAEAGASAGTAGTAAAPAGEKSKGKKGEPKAA